MGDVLNFVLTPLLPIFALVTLVMLWEMIVMDVWVCLKCRYLNYMSPRNIIQASIIPAMSTLRLH